MTLAEYELLCEAFDLRQVDLDYRIHQAAFLNMSVQAKKGKKQAPVYRKFKKFFDYKAAVKTVKEGKQAGKGSGLLQRFQQNKQIGGD